MSKGKAALCLALAVFFLIGIVCVSGCADSSVTADGKTRIEVISYKQEAVQAMSQIQDNFNATHDDIELVIDSPNDAVTIIKTRLIRENYPDIIAIGGDMTYASFLDSNMFMNIEDCPAVSECKPTYMEMLDALELIPVEGVYALPYMANAAGVLYNVDMFNEYGWQIPNTWDEFVALMQEIEADGVLPLYFGFKDSWTCLAPWNAIAASTADLDLAMQVNSGEAKFSEEYQIVAEEMQELMKYCEPDPVAYGYNDACTAFANGQSAMFVIGNYAIPQIRSVNPDMNIGSFTFPAMDTYEDNKLNSGIDLQFCVMAAKEDRKDAIYEVLDYFYDDSTIQVYLDDQGGIPCKEGDFAIPDELKDMTDYIVTSDMADYQDHHYPSEMSVDALIQTFLLDNSSNAAETFLNNFDTEWIRYNRDTIAKLEEYNASQGGN
ncbi:MAG: extracellular solute-binding protein [Clostridia bacterium]|nr:extracellular solute-binding protein [Clostridia bacterium]